LIYRAIAGATGVQLIAMCASRMITHRSDAKAHLEASKFLSTLRQILARQTREGPLLPDAVSTSPGRLPTVYYREL
jgi:hypothetical protein